MSDAKAGGEKKYTGGCHCGAVRFEVELDLGKGASRCNCTMCTKTGRANAIVKPASFKLLSGKDSLTEYHRADYPNHYPFCKNCGVHAYGFGNIPQLGGDYYAVNVNALDDVDIWNMKFIYFDGRHDNWAAGPRSVPWPVQAGT